MHVNPILPLLVDITLTIDYARESHTTVTCGYITLTIDYARESHTTELVDI